MSFVLGSLAFVAWPTVVELRLRAELLQIWSMPYVCEVRDDGGAECLPCRESEFHPVTPHERCLLAVGRGPIEDACTGCRGRFVRTLDDRGGPQVVECRSIGWLPAALELEPSVALFDARARNSALQLAHLQQSNRLALVEFDRLVEHSRHDRPEVAHPPADDAGHDTGCALYWKSPGLHVFEDER